MNELPIVVTGAGNGIGRQVALVLAQQNRTVVAMDIDGQKADETVEMIRAAGGRASSYALDVANHHAVVSVFSEVGAISGCVHAAGIVDTKPLEELGIEDWQRVLSVNLTGTFSVVQAAAEHLIQGSTIVTIASMAAQTISRYASPAYAASKGGVLALTKALAAPLGVRGIRINSVAPGAIDTQMLDHFGPEGRERLGASNPLGRLGTPGDVASAIAFLVSDDAGFVTGQTLSINGGAYV